MIIPEIDASECAIRSDAGVYLVDVREADEYEAGHIPGAHHIPLSDFAARVDEVPSGDVMVVCRSGHRSMKVCEILSTTGHSPVNVAGGTLAWIETGRPVIVGSERG